MYTYLHTLMALTDDRRRMLLLVIITFWSIS